MRCCCLSWVGLAGGSRRALRTRSPRILCRCPVLRRQILGVCRRGMGAESRGHRRRNRGCPALPQGDPRPHCAGRAVDGAVTRPHLSSSENNFEVPTRPFLSPREVLLCNQTVGNSAFRLHAQNTIKTGEVPGKNGQRKQSVTCQSLTRRGCLRKHWPQVFARQLRDPPQTERAKRPKCTRPVVRRGASLHANQAW